MSMSIPSYLTIPDVKRTSTHGTVRRVRIIRTTAGQLDSRGIWTSAPMDSSTTLDSLAMILSDPFIRA